MPHYVDGFIVPVPTANLAKYKAHARKCAKLFREHGALGYFECMGDDTPFGKATSFPRSVKLKENETVWFSWVIYASKKDRNRVMKAVLADPRMAAMHDPKNHPFDGKRMIFGGFKVAVAA